MSTATPSTTCPPRATVPIITAAKTFLALSSSGEVEPGVRSRPSTADRRAWRRSRAALESSLRPRWLSLSDCMRAIAALTSSTRSDAEGGGV
jgi:hypothetical protein